MINPTRSLSQVGARTSVAARQAQAAAAKPPPTSTDSVALTGYSPGALFWKEAAQTGLLAATPALGGVGAALSEAARLDLLGLVSNLEKAGLNFQRAGESLSTEQTAGDLLQGRELRVEGGELKPASLHGLGDLAALDALHNNDSQAPVENKPFLTSLQHLENSGVGIYDSGGDGQELGAFGSWQLLKDGREHENWQVVMEPVPSSVTGQVYANSADDLQRAAFFEFGGQGEGLPHLRAAHTLLGLAQQGCQFGSTDDPDQAYQRLLKKPEEPVSVRLGRAEIAKMTLDDFSDPSKMAGHTPELARFWGQALRPRIEADELYEENGGLQLGRLKEDLTENLPAQAYDEAELEQFRGEYLQLAHSARDISVAREAWEVAGFQTGGDSREERLQVMNGLLGAEAELGELENYEAQEFVTERAVEGYKLLLTHRLPDQSLTQAASTLTSLLHTVAKKEGWGEATDAFVFLQKGVARGELSADAPREFVQHCAEGRSTAEARDLLKGLDLEQEIAFEESQIRVGDHALELDL